MSKLNRRILRAACRLQAAYAAVHASCSRFELPQHAWADVQAAFRGWSVACDRGWKSTAARQRERLASDLEYFGNQLRSLTKALRTEPPQIPQLRLLYDELVAADDEFGGVTLADGELSITTEPITLDQIELGRFTVHLHLDRLGEESPYSITALDPNPAASYSETTHPHVSDARLCPGEGRGAIAGALAEGRLFDFFTIVDRILHTYAVGSAYVELDQWYGIRCHDCDATVDEDDVCTCTRCEERLCGECLVCCGDCEDGYCSSCIDRCCRCEEYRCSDCLTTCTRRHRAVCGSCCEEALCETCREELEDEQDEAESEESSLETSDAATEPTV